MLRVLRLALLAAVAAGTLAPSAQAVRLVLPESMQTAHFKLHFEGDAAPPASSVTRQQIGDLGGNLERAYALMTGEWGFPAPVDDGDGRIDVYVTDLDPIKALGLAFPDTSANQTSGYIHIDDDATEVAYLATHELFHLVQFGVWAPLETWLAEATAEWAGFRFLDFPGVIQDKSGDEVAITALLGMPDMSVDCNGDACGVDAYEDRGYSRWHFFQFLQERVGTGVVEDIFDRARVSNDTTIANVTFVDQALQAKGRALSDVFTDWHVANMGGDYAVKGLQGILPPKYSSTLTGLSSAALPTQKVAVNHLAARYLSFERGDGTGDEICHNATLNLSVSFPAGVSARPYFWWSGNAAKPTPLAVSGTSASLSIPWDTCTWPKELGYLSLPNPSLSVDAAVFSVSGSITVDFSSIARPTGPPPSSYTGPTIPAPLTDGPPSIALYGPELLRVSRKTRTLRLVVFSSGAGKLRAKLGATLLGTRGLRTGNNDLRFTLPRNSLRTLNARGTLTLTSLSPSGSSGATVTRNVTLTR
jgi:hypothetical protein